jgi:hypothetical protein
VATLSIRTKITLVVLGLFVAGSVSVVIVLNQMYESTTDLLAREAIERSAATFEGLEEAEASKLGSTLDAIRTRADLIELFVAGDRDALYEASLPLFEHLEDEYDITHWYWETPPPESDVFLRVHNAEIFGDSLTERHVYTEAVRTGEPSYGKELGQTAFALRVVKPIPGADGEIVGYLELGQEIDNFLLQMKEQTGGDFALIVEKEHLDRDSWASVRQVAGLRDNWDDHPDNLLVDATIEADLLTRYDGMLDDIPPGGEVLQTVREGGRTFLRGIFPVWDSAGDQVGGVIVLQDITEVTSSVNEVRTTLLAVGAALGTAFVLGLLVLLNRLVFARLGRMMTHLEEASVRVAGGDFDVPAPSYGSGPPDEIGRFEEFFERFLSVVADALSRLSKRR